MNEEHQFILALIALSLNTLVSVFTWLKSERARRQAEQTHYAVNSRMDEFKDMLEKASAKTIEEFKKDLRDAALLSAEKNRG